MPLLSAVLDYDSLMRERRRREEEESSMLCRTRDCAKRTSRLALAVSDSFSSNTSNFIAPRSQEPNHHSSSKASSEEHPLLSTRSLPSLSTLSIATRLIIQLNMPPSTHKIENAKSGRSKCKRCKELIANGTLRIVTEAYSETRDMDFVSNYHTHCFKVPPRAMKGVSPTTFVDEHLE